LLIAVLAARQARAAWHLRIAIAAALDVIDHHCTLIAAMHDSGETVPPQNSRPQSLPFARFCRTSQSRLTPRNIGSSALFLTAGRASASEAQGAERV
jgi:hypothetical protein